jgi:DNA-binding beta-propeller fold protein YncE
MKIAKASQGGDSVRKQSTGRSLRFALLLVLAAVVGPTPSSALAAKGHEFQPGASFGREGPGTKFGVGEVGAGAVAVDPTTHTVYVADLEAGAVSKFDENGNPVNFTAGPGAGSNDIGGFSFFTGEGFGEVAVDSATHVFYVADLSGAVKAFHEDGSPANFTAGPSAGGNEITSFEGIVLGEHPGVGVDANGDIYVANYEAGAVQIFAPSGEELTSFPIGRPASVAVDSHGAVYVSGYYAEHEGVEKFIPSEFPVTASTTYSSGIVVTSEPVFAIAVDRSSDELYAAVGRRFEPRESQILQFDEGGAIISEFAGPGEPGATARSEGVAIDEATEKVYVSDFNGERQVEVFTPPPPNPPKVESTTIAKVTTTSANFEARIDPELFDTHYRFQYVTQAHFEASGFAGAAETPEADLGSSGKPQTAHGFAGGLNPDTAYRFRVVAENENGEATSAEPAPRFSTFAALSAGLPDGRAYEMVSPPQKGGEVFALEPDHGLGGSCKECLPGINGQMMPMQSTADGEAVVYQGQPFSGGFSSRPNEYLAGRTAGGWGTQSLSPAGFANGGIQGQGYKAFSADLSRSVIFQVEPTLSPEAPSRGGRAFANLYLRGKDGSLQPLVTEEPPQRKPGEGEFTVIYAGANAGTETTPPLGHLIFAANDALTEEVPGIAPEAPEIQAEQKCKNPGENCNLYEWSEGELHLVNVLPNNSETATGAVIGSGRQLAESSFGGPDVDHAISDDGSRIFWSRPSGQVYARIDGVETEELEDHAGRFLTASPDGSKVLLSDGCLYDMEALAEPCEDLTEGEGEFKGILGAAEDLSRVYFIDTAVLPGAGQDERGEEAQGGEPNLYIWEGGAPAFIGTLSQGGESDNAIGSNSRYGAWKASPPSRLAQVSPDGRYLAFMSRARLSGFDNTVAGGGNCRQGELTPACPEVFAYDDETASLDCASCNPSGSRPLGPSNLSLIKNENGYPPFPQPGNLSGQGRVFFESQDALSPRDTNGHIQDVYEWEPNGVGSCKRVGGCVFLISSGHGIHDSMFLDSSDSGNDAFFVSREQLVLADKDDQLDLYDARVGGGIASQGETLSPECQGEACQPAAFVPNDPTPSSAAFNGAGNVKEKQKRKHHKKKHKRHAKKHSHKRAAKTNRGGAK